MSQHSTYSSNMFVHHIKKIWSWVFKPGADSIFWCEYYFCNILTFSGITAVKVKVVWNADYYQMNNNEASSSKLYFGIKGYYVRGFLWMLTVCRKTEYVNEKNPLDGTRDEIYFIFTVTSIFLSFLIYFDFLLFKQKGKPKQKRNTRLSRNYQT